VTIRWLARVLHETNPWLLARFARGLGWGGARAMRAFRRRAVRGELFPAFLFISVTSRCNLRCRGCWATHVSPARELDLATLDRIVTQAKARGSTTIGILGGEPLLHAGLLELLARHRDCYFLLFSNGTLIDREVARALRRAGNVSPLISIEGRAAVSDERRGGGAVLARTMAGVRHCVEEGLVTGAASSLCRSNIGELATEAFLDELIGRGVHYAWFYLYRPVGADPAPELALDQEQVLALRRFLVEMRRRKPLMLVDSYWGDRGQALCPAAMGIACHIGPGGEIEACPPIQLATESVRDGDLYDLVTGSAWLREFREVARRATPGCVLLERPAELLRAAARVGAIDSSGRGRVLAELAAMDPRPSHHTPGRELAEPFGPYRWAKRRWFFGLGAYG
jgi:MoaA/NifB/PqqE/SkfB family radical SAM enzyme